MNKKRIGIFIALVAVVCLGLNAQRATSLKINEVLVTNEQNYQDDYGLHNAWIEIFNTSFATVNIEGCYLTNDKDNPTKYPIPKGDILTQIKPRQHTLFWADGMPNRGTFHVNFTLDPNKENYIALYDSNGKTLIDEVTIPAGILADQSYARQEDGSANWVIKGGGEHSYVTPSTNNMTQDKNEKIENFKKHDEDGFGMAIIAMSVVFIGLILLLNGSYYMSLFNKPVILSATVSVDAWNEDWGKLFGYFSAVMVIRNNERTSFSAGAMAMTLFSSMPVMPIITYWHRFNNPDLSIDITMPSQFYLRYQMKKQRISVGAFMSSDNFYLRTILKGAPEMCYYNDAVLKPEIHYEYIINKHIYLSVHTGVSMVMKGGLYKKNRKGIKVKNEEGKNEVEPIVKQDRSPIPFFNIGISYSLFR